MLEAIAKRKIAMPSTRYAMQSLASKFDATKKKFIEIIRAQKYICVTADVWSARAQSYLGLTVHFIASNYERKSFLLAFRQLETKQTYMELTLEMIKIFKEFEISISQITNIVTDGGSAFCKAFKEFGSVADALIEDPIEEQNNEPIHDSNNELSDESSRAVLHMNDGNAPLDLFIQFEDGEQFFSNIINFDWNVPDNINSENSQNNLSEENQSDDDFYNDLFEEPIVSVPEVSENEGSDRIELPPQRRCASHLLNLVSKDFEKKINGFAKIAYITAMNKLHSLWILTRRSSLANGMSKTVLGTALLIPCETRWNSKFFAVEKVVNCGNKKINELILKLSNEVDSARHLQQLSINDWTVITLYLKVMKPVAIALDILQGEFNCSQGFIMPTLASMKQRISMIDGGNLALHFKSVILDIIATRFAKVIDVSESSRDLVLASISLPKFKIDFISNGEDKTLARNMLKHECFKFSNRSHQVEETASSNSEENRVEANEEFFVFYRSEANTRRLSIEDEIDSEIQRYLKDVRTDNTILDEYKSIKQIFFKYNTTLSASAAVERVFSQSLIIFTPRRNRIKSDSFERTLFLKYNRHILNSD